MQPWYESCFTGLFTQFRLIAPRPHDPPLPMCGASLPAWGPRSHELASGGAGWSQGQAEAACVGEAIERWQAYALPSDQWIEASWDSWPLDEPATDPERWVLFHEEQHGAVGFPFARLTPYTTCRWTCCRQVQTGLPFWVPEELVYLYARQDTGHRFGPGISTGLTCGRRNDPVLLRGLQEVIERDGVVGAWWGSYPWEEWPAEQVFAMLEPALPPRLQRPNLRYRFYRVRSPYSEHITVVTLEGQDWEGFCFSTGSACRETRAASWTKSLLEVVQGRHFVRYLLEQRKSRKAPLLHTPTDFAEHAVYYSVHPQRRAATVLERAQRPMTAATESEGLATLVARLGPERPVLFRNLTPPALAQEFSDWHVLRVLVPGLQPLHGDHRLPQLGGPLWKPRSLQAWDAMPPHPFA